jgi:TolB protein
MLSQQYSKIKIVLVSMVLLGLVTGCKTIEAVPEPPLTIVYGGKTANDKNKAIYFSDEEGKTRVRVVSATLSDGYPAVSPSGELVAFYGKYDNYKTWSIHTVGTDGNNVRRLTHLKHVWDSSPSWSPDGKTIAFAREYRADDGDFSEEIWLMNSDGTNQRQIKALKGRSPEFMQDGRLLFQTKSGPSQISIANIDGSNIIQLTHDDTKNMQPKISPDGTKIAYLANRDGNQEVYIMNVDGTEQTRITRNSIAEWDPAWSLDGSKVFFSSQNVHGFYDIYKANTDGSMIEKVVTNGSQASGLFYVNRDVLPRFVGSR